MKKATQYTEKDNVATCLEDVQAGDRVETGLFQVKAVETVPVYHKIALTAMQAGAYVYKYGEVIGVSTQDIPAGTHVHVHNMESRRGRGDQV